MTKKSVSNTKKKSTEKKTRRVLIILLLIILLMGVTVGYAILSTNLNINGTSRIKNSTWDVHFQNIAVTNGSVQALEAPTIDASKLNVNYTVDLNVPGDYYDFTIDVKNSGSVDAKLSALPILNGVSSEQEVYTNYHFTHADGSPIQVGETIETGQSQKFRVHIEYDRNIVASQLPKDNQVLHLSVAMSYVQA